jgi:hypothetical protein
MPGRRGRASAAEPFGRKSVLGTAVA